MHISAQEQAERGAGGFAVSVRPSAGSPAEVAATKPLQSIKHKATGTLYSLLCVEPEPETSVPLRAVGT